jgi:FkbM family methyltransferase
MDPFYNISIIGSLNRTEFEKTCSAFIDHIYLGDNVVLCKVLTKYKVYVDAKDLGICPHLIMDGYWESWLTQLLARIVKPGAVCLDIGANFGYYSLLLAELCGTGGKTISIEPNPHICNFLKSTQFLNGWQFDLVQAALSDKKGEAVLTITDRELGGGTIKPNDLIPGRTQVSVPTISVDELMKEKNIDRVDVIKMDVEGVEPLVFAGMRQTISDNPNIQMIIEYTPSIYNEAKEFTEYLFSEFLIYQVNNVDEIKKLDKSFIPYMLQEKGHLDLYLRHKKNKLPEL